MGTKYTICSVSDYLEKYDINHECTLLSNEYLGVTKPLQLKCNVCGQIFERSFEKIKKAKRFCCYNCSSSKSRSETTIEIIKDYLAKNDLNNECTLLSTKVRNSKEKLQLRCNICGQEFTKSFQDIKTGKYFCCRDCTAKKIGQKNIKYSPEIVENLLSEQGCHLLEPYINITTKIKCKCSNGHEFDFVLANFLRNQNPCPKCAYEKRRGPGSPVWADGGRQETLDFLRHQLSTWKKETFQAYDYTCDISGERGGKLVIHHVKKSFSEIVKQAVKNTGIPILPHIADYTEQDREILVNEIRKLHTIDIGVPIKAELHQEFHRLYGTRNNTLQQYEEFKKKKRQELL